MKIIYSLMFLLLFVSYSFAQSNSDLQVKINKDTIPAVKEPIPSTFGFKGFGYISTGVTEDIGNGGGFGINLRFNINKYFGIGVQGLYTNAQDKAYYHTTSNMFDTRLLLTFQKETAYNQKGLVPWLDLGMSVNTGVFSVSGAGSVTGVGVGFVIGAGLKYNFEKFYLGASVDYNLAYISLYTRYSANIDPSALRIYGELGWRF